MSDERRIAVAKKIHEAHCALWDDLESHEEDWKEPVIQQQFLIEADAAINAVTPDRAEFTRLTNAWEQAILARHHDPCELWQGECQQILGDLEILVFGEEIGEPA